MKKILLLAFACLALGLVATGCGDDDDDDGGGSTADQPAETAAEEPSGGGGSAKGSPSRSRWRASPSTRPT